MREMEKAIYNKGDYCVIDEYKRKTVDGYEWACFSKEQRAQKMKEVFDLSLPEDDQIGKNTLPLPFLEIGVIPHMPSSTLKQLWNYAIYLKNNSNIVKVDDSKTGVYYDEKHFEVSG